MCVVDYGSRVGERDISIKYLFSNLKKMTISTINSYIFRTKRERMGHQTCDLEEQKKQRAIDFFFN